MVKMTLNKMAAVRQVVQLPLPLCLNYVKFCMKTGLCNVNFPKKLQGSAKLPKFL